MKLRGSSYVFIGTIAVMLFVVIWSLVVMEFFASKLLPLLIGSMVLVLAAIGLWREIKTGDKAEATATEGKASGREGAGESWQKYLLNVAWVAGFTLGIVTLGFIITIPIFVLAYMKWLGTRWRTAIIYAVLTPLLVYFIFERALQVDLYRGLLFT